MNARNLITLSIFASLAAAAQAGEFATFANRGTVIFTVSNNTLTGGGTIDQFTFGSTVYDDVTLSLNAPIARTTTSTLGAGGLVFQKGSTTLLTINFDSASLTGTKFNATTAEDDNVVYGGLVQQLPGQAVDNGFSFALSPKIGVSGQYDASFSAVGNVQAVPEPATMAALGLGAAALLRRRRR